VLSHVGCQNIVGASPFGVFWQRRKNTQDGRSPTSTVPPYLGYRTLQNFLFSLRQGVPQRIDRGLMPRLGGTVQKQLFHALRYLGLITEAGVTEPSLKQLVFAEGAERKQLLQTILRSAYPFLCGEGIDSFDLATATPRQLDEQFQTFGIGGETVRKAATFFVHAATDAGMTISPHIHMTPGKPQESAGQLTRPRHGQKSRHRSGSEGSKSSRGQNGTRSPVEEEARWRSAAKERLVQTFVAKLPEFNPQWEPQIQNQWFGALTRLMTLANGDHAGEPQEGEEGED
jgi:hypothetical protein